MNLNWLCAFVSFRYKVVIFFAQKTGWIQSIAKLIVRDTTRPVFVPPGIWYKFPDADAWELKHGRSDDTSGTIMFDFGSNEGSVWE